MAAHQDGGNLEAIREAVPLESPSLTAEQGVPPPYEDELEFPSEHVPPTYQEALQSPSGQIRTVQESLRLYPPPPYAAEDEPEWGNSSFL
eukprot:m.113129 g.113129  ORF g.113129 m.113129 type:complete len:90 (+) comp51861_c0_seq1:85-354(+)